MLSVLLLTVTALAGQAPAPRPAPAPAPAPATATPPAEKPEAAPAVTTDGYSYNREGRRDPFVSLLGRGGEPVTATRAAGLRGMLVSEATVKGILRDRSGYLAMIQASDKKTYIIRTGERLLDGVVKAITQDTVTFSQDLRDPLSPVKQRDVPKRLRAPEGGS